MPTLSRSSAASTAGFVEAGFESKLEESNFDDPSILEAIRPQVKAQARTFMKTLLMGHGTFIVDEADVDAFVDAKFRNEGKEGMLAGMNRDQPRGTPLRVSVPRSRGDEPGRLQILATGAMCSPLARG